MTFAFNLDDFFQDVLLQVDDTLRYAVFDKTLDTAVEEQIDHIHNTVIAAGAKLSTGDMENFLARGSHRLQPQLLHPRQVHARGPAGRRPDRRDGVRELQPAVAGHATMRTCW